MSLPRPIGLETFESEASLRENFSQKWGKHFKNPDDYPLFLYLLRFIRENANAETADDTLSKTNLETRTKFAFTSKEFEIKDDERSFVHDIALQIYEGQHSLETFVNVFLQRKNRDLNPYENILFNIQLINYLVTFPRKKLAIIRYAKDNDLAFSEATDKLEEEIKSNDEYGINEGRTLDDYIDKEEMRKFIGVCKAIEADYKKKIFVKNLEILVHKQEIPSKKLTEEKESKDSKDKDSLGSKKSSIDISYKIPNLMLLVVDYYFSHYLIMKEKIVDPVSKSQRLTRAFFGEMMAVINSAASVLELTSPFMDVSEDTLMEILDGIHNRFDYAEKFNDQEIIQFKKKFQDEKLERNRKLQSLKVIAELNDEIQSFSKEIEGEGEKKENLKLKQLKDIVAQKPGIRSLKKEIEGEKKEKEKQPETVSLASTVVMRVPEKEPEPVASDKIEAPHSGGISKEEPKEESSDEDLRIVEKPGKAEPSTGETAAKIFSIVAFGAAIGIGVLTALLFWEVFVAASVIALVGYAIAAAVVGGGLGFGVYKFLDWYNETTDKMQKAAIVEKTAGEGKQAEAKVEAEGKTVDKEKLSPARVEPDSPKEVSQSVSHRNPAPQKVMDKALLDQSKFHHDTNGGSPKKRSSESPSASESDSKEEKLPTTKPLQSGSTSPTKKR